MRGSDDVVSQVILQAVTTTATLTLRELEVFLLWYYDPPEFTRSSILTSQQLEMKQSNVSTTMRSLIRKGILREDHDYKKGSHVVKGYRPSDTLLDEVQRRLNILWCK